MNSSNPGPPRGRLSWALYIVSPCHNTRSMATAASLPVCVYNGTTSDLGGLGFFVNVGDLITVDAAVTTTANVGVTWFAPPGQPIPGAFDGGKIGKIYPPYGRYNQTSGSTGHADVAASTDSGLAVRTTTTVWRAPTPWLHMPHNAYPVAQQSGVCTFSLGDGSAAAQSGLFQCTPSASTGAGNSALCGRASCVRAPCGETSPQ